MIPLYFSPPLSLSLSYTQSTQPCCFLSLWMKEEVQRRLKCKESSVSAISLRQEWHHSRQQQQQQRQWQAVLPNYSWGLKNATAKELSVYKTHSLSSLCVFKAVPFMSYNPKLTPSKKRFPSQWRPPGLRKEDAKLKIQVSKCHSLTWLKSLQFVTSGALLQNKTTLCDTWAHTKWLLKHYVLVGDTFHIHNEGINKLCLLSSYFWLWESSETILFPRKSIS